MAEPRKIEIPPELLAMGYPEDLELPASPAELLDPGLPGDWGLAAEWVRHDEGLDTLAKTAAWGAGAGNDPKTGAPAVVFVADPEHAEQVQRELPTEVGVGGKRLPVAVLALPQPLSPRAHPPGAPSSIYSGAFTGSLVTTDVDNLFFAYNAMPGGGTLTGIFPRLFGSGSRALTNAHVALDAGIDNLLSGLPASLGDLFRSPHGRHLYAYDQSPSNTGAYELFEVDTRTPILVFVPPWAVYSVTALGSFGIGGASATSILSTIGGSLLTSLTSFTGGFPLGGLFGGIPLTFLYVDIAAGPVRPRVAPQLSSRTRFAPNAPPVPEERRTARGAKMSLGRRVVPGEQVYGIGARLGLRWGALAVAGLVQQISITLPVPPPLPSVRLVFLFNQDLYIMPIEPGDSGMAPVAQMDNAPLGLAGLGSGPHTGGIGVTLATPLNLVRLFGDVQM